VTIETHDDEGREFPARLGPHAAVRHHGEVVAYYGSYNGTKQAALDAAKASIEDRLTVLCGAS
jgi:hypothetical protein